MLTSATKSTPTDSNPAVTPPQRRTKYLNWALVILVLFSTSFIGGWLGGRQSDKETNRTVEQQRVVLDNQAELVSSVAKKVGASVVSVNVTAQQASSNP